MEVSAYMANIEYNIDKVIIKRNWAYIFGWAYKQGVGPATIEVKDQEDVKIEKRVGRADLVEKFKEEEASESGFSVVMPAISKTTLEFKVGDEVLNIKVNINRIASLKGDSKLDRARKLLNFVSIKKGLREIKENGLSNTLHRVQDKIEKGNEAEHIDFYNKWFKNNQPSEEELEEQRKHKFQYEPKISVIVPTYNTDKVFLCDMIESIRNQTYSNWELCIADGASTNEITLKTLKEYEKIDKRIKVKYLAENYMISGNTNEALEMVTGDYIGLLDHDDLLTVNALYEYVKVINEDRDYEFIYCDEDKTDENELEYFDPHFKQSWAPDTLRTYNYITHFSVFSKKLSDEIGLFNSNFDGSQDYDMILRLTEKAKKVAHIPKILYHWRVHSQSTAGGIGAKPYCIIAAMGALEEHIKRIGYTGKVREGKFSASYKVDFDIIGEPMISIIIPNKDGKELLEKCIKSIEQKTSYNNYEIIVVENNSESKEIFDYYDELKKNEKIRIIHWDGVFNYSAINNFAVKEARGEYLLFLNNDIEVMKGKWIEEMLMHAQRKEVGAVGAKLYYPDKTIQHCGVVLGVGGVADHLGKYFKSHDNGHMGRLSIVENVSAVTGACMMVSKKLFDEVGGFEEKLAVAYNDVDLCMKFLEKGYVNVFTPFAELYHHESKTRGQENTPEKEERFKKEVEIFESRWGKDIEDPYYNPNFLKKNAGFLFYDDDDKEIDKE